MIIYDHLWYYAMIIIYDTMLWSSMIIYDRLWSSTIIYDHLRSFMIIYDHLWASMTIYDHLWSSMIIYDLLASCWCNSGVVDILWLFCGIKMYRFDSGRLRVIQNALCIRMFLLLKLYGNYVVANWCVYSCNMHIILDLVNKESYTMCFC